MNHLGLFEGIGCGYKVEFIKDGIKIFGRHYSTQLLFNIRNVLQAPNIYSLNVGCDGKEKITLEFINKLIEKIK